ncbi:hypothetical protein HZQ13_15265 [Elizabethkingia anophelis]|nr:hypothetical protein [Elizabethkingia anophelis]
MKNNTETYMCEDIINNPLAIEGRDYIIMHIDNQPSKKAGRKPSKEVESKILAYNEYRQKGHNQKESAKLADITEKTAGKYEVKRLEGIQEQKDEINKLITRLEQKADDPATPAKDLLLLTAEIERLNEKKKKCTE